jgi:peptidoglycan-associated lipoprotein
MKKSLMVSIAVMGVIWLGASGCATKTYIQKQVAEAVDSKVGEVEKQVAANQEEIAALKEATTGKLSDRTEAAFSLAKDALARAEETGKLAKGKLVYQVTFTDESVHFGFNKSHLSQEAKAALNHFAKGLRAENKNIYIEIQGHTDNIGPEGYNMRLGKARADAAMWYLQTQHGLPLHRMNTISYGESKPLVENKNRSNRAINRRITLVVIE